MFSIKFYVLYFKLWLILKISISSKLFRVASCMLKDAVLLYNLDFIIIIIFQFQFSILHVACPG